MLRAHKIAFITLAGLGVISCATERTASESAALDVDQPQPCLNENVQLCLNDAMRKSRLRTNLTPAQERQLLQQQMTLIEKMVGGEVPIAKAKEPVHPAAEPTESEKLQDAISGLPQGAAAPTQPALELPQVPDQSLVPEMPH
jgi:hypothetical protein